jgi:hypothetical protein
MIDATLGPSAKPTATTRALVPKPRPCSLAGYVARSSAVLTPMMALAPTPWNRRATISTGSDHASAHASDAAVNSARPAQ